LRTRLQTDLNAAPGRFAEFAAMVVDKTRQDIRDALPKNFGRGSACGGSCYESGAESRGICQEGGRVLQRSRPVRRATAARDEAQKIVAATKEAANKTFDVMDNWLR